MSSGVGQFPAESFGPLPDSNESKFAGSPVSLTVKLLWTFAEEA